MSVSPFTVVWSVGGVSMMYFFFMMLYHKVRLHAVREKMQHEGIISPEADLNAGTLLSLITFFAPVTKYTHLGHKEHNRLAMRTNIFLAIVGIVFVVMVITLMASSF